jgi:ABC-type spermidine/putrescine transport system permease subunit I
MSLPGALATFFMNHPTVGEHCHPVPAGGTSGVYGNLIQDFFTRVGNWPLGARWR